MSMVRQMSFQTYKEHDSESVISADSTCFKHRNMSLHKFWSLCPSPLPVPTFHMFLVRSIKCDRVRQISLLEGTRFSAFWLGTYKQLLYHPQYIVTYSCVSFSFSISFRYT